GVNRSTVDLDIEGGIAAKLAGAGQRCAADKLDVGESVGQVGEQDPRAVVLVVLQLELEVQREIRAGGIGDADADESEVGRRLEWIDLHFGADGDLGIL